MGQSNMIEQKIDRNTLVEGLKKLSPVLSHLTKAKQTTGRLIALCDLTGATLEDVSAGNNYFDYTADALRDILDERDIKLHQAAQVIEILCDMAMDSDSLVGYATADLENSMKYLRDAKKQGATNHD